MRGAGANKTPHVPPFRYSSSILGHDSDAGGICQRFMRVYRRLLPPTLGVWGLHAPKLLKTPPSERHGPI